MTHPYRAGSQANNDKTENLAVAFEQIAALMIRTDLMFAGANNAFIDKVGDTCLDDGILTAKEICNLNLQTVNLVVLSACKSGLGEVSRDGVYGLQRAFKKTGVKSIVMSLWAIDDSVTQDFMVYFYKGLASGLSKAKALLQEKC